MRVAIVIPYRESDIHRREALDWVLHNLASHHATRAVFVGEGSLDGPWIKAEAVADGIRQADAAVVPDVVIVHDADSWVEPHILSKAIEQIVFGGFTWSMPYRTVARLTRDATIKVVRDGEDLMRVAAQREAILSVPYRHEAAGGIVCFRRVVWDQVPLDPRFRGYGSEDFAWSYALTALVGARGRVEEGKLWHLYHEPQQQISRGKGSVAGEALRREYQRAKGDGALMRRLVNEARALLKTKEESKTYANA